jgi:hypothetical protein
MRRAAIGSKKKKIGLLPIVAVSGNKYENKT